MNLLDGKAAGVLERVLETLPQIMDVTSFRDLAAGEVFELARLSRLTFYDASYLALAQRTKEALVTDDRSLAKAARKTGIAVYSAAAYGETVE